MRRPALFSGSGSGRSRTPVGGFTLPEILIALTVFMLLVAGIIAANLFGMRMLQVNQTKLTITEWSRITFGRITDEIHAGNVVQVGNITNGVFAGLLDGETQQGTGLLIYPTTNTTRFIVYYVDSTNQTFLRMTDQTNTAVILANAVTNQLVFTAQDFAGNVLTNNLNNRVIHLRLDFYQPKRFAVDAEYYKLETSVTRRAL